MSQQNPCCWMLLLPRVSILQVNVALRASILFIVISAKVILLVLPLGGSGALSFSQENKMIIKIRQNSWIFFFAFSATSRLLIILSFTPNISSSHYNLRDITKIFHPESSFPKKYKSFTP